MSLFIKGVDMPKNGRVTIDLASEETGTNILARITDDTTGKLIEHKGVVVIHTPHGRLIDADRLLEPRRIAKFIGGQEIFFADGIRYAPTIVEAEDGNERTD